MQINKVNTIVVKCPMCGKQLDYVPGKQDGIDILLVIDPHKCEPGAYYDDNGAKHYIVGGTNE